MSLEEIRICRFCLTDKEPLTNIFEQSTGNSLLLKAIYVLSIQVYPGDNKPKFSCTVCSELIMFFNSFKANCFTCDRILDMFPCFPLKKLDYLNIQSLTHVARNLNIPFIADEKKKLEVTSPNSSKPKSPEAEPDVEIPAQSHTSINDKPTTPPALEDPPISSAPENPQSPPVAQETENNLVNGDQGQETDLNHVPMDIETDIPENTQNAVVTNGKEPEQNIKVEYTDNPDDFRERCSNIERNPPSNDEIGEVIVIDDDDDVAITSVTQNGTDDSTTSSQFPRKLKRPLPAAIIENIMSLDPVKERQVPDCCSQKFEKAAAFIKHMNLNHKNSNLIICKICNIGFFEDSYFESHNQFVHLAK